MNVFFLNDPFITPAGIKQRPFQARFEQIISKTAIGDRGLERRRTGSLFRATNGETRREYHSEVAPGEFQTEVQLYHPATQTGYVLDEASKTVIEIPLIDYGVEEGIDVLSGGSSRDSRQGEDLGIKSIEGFACRGYRVAQAEHRTVEYWVAEEISEVLLAKSVNADEVCELRLFDIQRVEPDGHLFTVPADYHREVFPVGGQADDDEADPTPSAAVGGSEPDLFIDAAASGNTALVQTMLDGGIHVDAKDGAGNSALIYAASGRNLEVVRILLNGGADVNARGGDGSTPLIYAALTGRADMVKLLLGFGADADVKNRNGVSALDCAISRQHADVIELLTSEMSEH